MSTEIVTVSEEARRAVVDARTGQHGAEDYALWIEVIGTQGPEYAYDLYLHPVSYATEEDSVQQHDDLAVVIPAGSVDRLKGATVGFSSGPGGEGWLIDNPNRPPSGPILQVGAPGVGAPGMGAPAAPPASPAVDIDMDALDVEGDVATRIRQVLEHHINPAIASHGGRADLIGVEGASTAVLRLSGGCQGCGMARVTLSQGIEVAIKKAVPEIENVVDATDHAAGTDPYFAPSKK